MSEDGLEARLRRGLREAPPGRRVRRSALPILRSIAAVALLIAAVAIGTAAGLRLAEERGSVATPPPAISAPPVALDARYGLVVETNDALLVRRETDGYVLRRLPIYTEAAVSYAISPTGRYVAYWGPGESRQHYSLNVYDAAADAEPRQVLTAADALYLPATLAWASDETALAYGMVALQPRRDLAARPPLLRIVDLVTNRLSGRTRRTRLPAARVGSRTAADRRHGDGLGRRGLAVCPRARGRDVLEGRARGRPAVSHDQRAGGRGMAAAIDRYICADGRDCASVRVWPIEREFQTAHGSAAEPGHLVHAVRFIPGSRHVLILSESDPDGRGMRLEVADPAGRGQPRVISTYGRDGGETFVRPDGRAVYLFDLGTGGWRGLLVALDGSVSHGIEIPQLNSRPVGAVVLDEAEAARIARLHRPPHLLARDEVAALVPEFATVRVDRTSYILTTWGEAQQTRGFVSANDPDTAVWVVARIGEFDWSGTLGTVSGPRANQPCQVHFFDARTGVTLSYSLGGRNLCAPFMPE
ncbi:MAG: hypothetical protein ACRDF0_06845 [Candidatus Limnocylindria bacterium]